MPKNNKPLEKYYRQPSVYISLPTKGKYYTSDVFTQSETGEIPILPMTAKDELAFKTPDAMINGQATVDVIKSCVPKFLDPWKITNYDDDSELIKKFLVDHEDQKVIVPYKENRAVLFDSRLFHGSNAPRFKSGYINHRINITMLFGKKTKM